MPPRTAVGTTAVGVGVMIVVAVAGFLFFADKSNPNPIASSTHSMTSITSVKTIVSSAPTGSSSAVVSATSQTCYQGVLPTNGSASGGQPAYSRTVFNVTQAFGSWNWTSLATFTVGSYKFDLVGSQNSQTEIYLEPQVLINVTNSQGQVQRTDLTDLGSWNGDVWPPDLSGGPNVLFGGDVIIEWLFLCNSQSVFLEVTAQ